MFITGLDHAGTAATALIAGIASMNDSSERVVPLQYLQAMRDAMKSMSSTYKAAERMSNVLDKVFEDPGWTEAQKGPFSGSYPAESSHRRSSSGLLKRKNTFSQGDPPPPIAQRQRLNTWTPNPAARTEPVNSSGYSAPKKYYRSTNMDRDPGFGLDSIVTSSNWNLGTFPTVGTEWPTDVNGMNLTDPLFFDEDFLNAEQLSHGVFKEQLPGTESVDGIMGASSNLGVEGPVSPVPFWPGRVSLNRTLSLSDHRNNMTWI